MALFSVLSLSEDKGRRKAFSPCNPANFLLEILLKHLLLFLFLLLFFIRIRCAPSGTIRVGP